MSGSAMCSSTFAASRGLMALNTLASRRPPVAELLSDKLGTMTDAGFIAGAAGLGPGAALAGVLPLSVVLAFAAKAAMLSACSVSAPEGVIEVSIFVVSTAEES